MNTRNLELFKALLHLSQMPGYFLNLTVIDDESGRKQLKRMMPEILDDGPGDGDAVYHIDYLEGTDFATEDFENIVAKICSGFTYVFVNAGNDIENINLAIRLKAEALRSGRKTEDYKLFVNVHNEEIWDERNDTLCRGIIPVGSLRENYDYLAVTYSNIEEISEKIHLARHSSKPWHDYLNDEYNRHSVFARTLSYIYKIRILGEDYGYAGRPESPSWNTESELEEIWNSMSKDEILWKKYEHMRWNMYTRTLGYRADSNGVLKPYLDADKRFLYDIRMLKQNLKSCEDAAASEKLKEELKAKEKEKKENWKVVKDIRISFMIHNDLVPFDELLLEDKIKDNLELTDEVVEVLRKA